ESLEIITGLWAGHPFSYRGKHHSVDTDGLATPKPPPPVQQPRIPIWVVGAWNRPQSMRRAIKYDGIIPNVLEDGSHVAVTPDHVAEMTAHIHTVRPDPIDVIVEGSTSPASTDDRARLAGWATAGATWWLETMWNVMDDASQVMDRIAAGPTRG
ncbi:MAG: LLM class flavin-dependent oxidoreductase, partial [Acidimicrobiia bacterium]|nr:LLM class flavin-dependent oxidoreductase [Acidimicrobiia bacterium]